MSKLKIFYKENEIVNSETSKIIKCKNQKFEDNLIVKFVEVVNLITFTINSTLYQAEEGMTWEEWIDSSYNIDGFHRAQNLADGVQTTGDYFIYTSDQTFVERADNIIEYHAYILKYVNTTGGSN